jgi:hypothetical protein
MTLAAFYFASSESSCEAIAIASLPTSGVVFVRPL